MYAKKSTIRPDSLELMTHSGRVFVYHAQTIQKLRNIIADHCL